MLSLLIAMALLQPTLKVGIIADELVDYSTWAKPYASEWTGEKVVHILREQGFDAHLLTRDQLVVENMGELPAVGVHFHAPTCSDSLRLSESYFWLNPGEKTRVRITFAPNTEGNVPSDKRFGVGAWNADYVPVEWE